MKRFLKALAAAALTGVVAFAAFLAFLYATFCGGHPHGLC